MKLHPIVPMPGTSCVGIIYVHVHVRLGKIDGELIMPKAVITPGSHFYQGGVIYAYRCECPGSHICLGGNDWGVKYA